MDDPAHYNSPHYPGSSQHSRQYPLSTPGQALSGSQYIHSAGTSTTSSHRRSVHRRTLLSTTGITTPSPQVGSFEFNGFQGHTLLNTPQPINGAAIDDGVLLDLGGQFSSGSPSLGYRNCIVCGQPTAIAKKQELNKPHYYKLIAPRMPANVALPSGSSWNHHLMTYRCQNESCQADFQAYRFFITVCFENGADEINSSLIELCHSLGNLTQGARGTEDRRRPPGMPAEQSSRNPDSQSWAHYGGPTNTGWDTHGLNANDSALMQNSNDQGDNTTDILFDHSSIGTGQPSIANRNPADPDAQLNLAPQPGDTRNFPHAAKRSDDDRPQHNKLKRQRNINFEDFNKTRGQGACDYCRKAKVKCERINIGAQSCEEHHKSKKIQYQVTSHEQRVRLDREEMNIGTSEDLIPPPRTRDSPRRRSTRRNTDSPSHRSRSGRSKSRPATRSSGSRRLEERPP